MSGKKENAAVIGVGLAACAVCCAGPILGVLTAIGLGTAAGFALFGALAIVVGLAAVGLVVMRRHRRSVACAVTVTPASVPVAFTQTRSPS